MIHKTITSPITYVIQFQNSSETYDSFARIINSDCLNDTPIFGCPAL